jgi:signal transduction histidine kinase
MGNKKERTLITDERNRYSREIHDDVSQNLTAISLNLEFCKVIVDKKPEKAREIIANCLELISDTAKEIKYTVYEPASILNNGLVDSIRLQIESYLGKISCSLLVKGKVKLYPPFQELLLWRIFMEIFALLMVKTKDNAHLNIEVVFDFTAKPSYLQFYITGCQFDFTSKSNKSSHPGIGNLLKTYEELNLKTAIKIEEKNSSIKINL